MKLLYCKKCNDVINLKADLKICSCGETEGKYIDNLNAEYSGKHAVPFAIDNFSFFARINGNPETKKFYDTVNGVDGIQCWIMGPNKPNYETIKKVAKRKIPSCGGARKMYNKKPKAKKYENK